MSESPSKRRKTSPTTSFPIDAPFDTPSRIPVLRQQQDATIPGRPSFASPTRASLARHNPELLKRPSSSGTGMGTPAKKNLDDVFAKALGQARPSIEDSGNDASQGGNNQIVEVQGASRTPGGGLSGKPRRMSRSPVKSAKAVEWVLDAPDLQGIANPFGKKGGLRRSPISSSQADSTQQESQFEQARDDINPFKKRTGLRRSPTSSHVEPASQELESIRKTPLRRSPIIRQDDVVGNSELEIHQERAGPSRKAAGALRRSPVLSQALSKEPEPVKRSGLRRSPVISQPTIIPETSGSENLQEEGFNPFKKTALRRSPVPKLIENENEVPEPFGTTPPGPPPSRALLPAHTIHERAHKEALHSKDPKPLDIARPSKAPQPMEAQSTEALIPAKAPEVVRSDKAAGDLIAEKSKETNQPTFSIPLGKAATPVEKPQLKMPEATENFPSKQPTKIQINKSKGRPASARASISEEIILEKHSKQPSNTEPELPPTPTQLGLADPIVTTPPVGIHNTPSKRARRNQALAGKIRSSPLKPRDDRPEESSARSENEVSSMPSLIPDSQVTNKAEKSKRRKSARFLVPVDPYAEKKNERDALLKQIQELQADIAIGNQETERLRLLQEPKKKSPIAAAKASEELVAMLLRSKPSDPAPDSKPKPSSIFKSIEAFLPFRSRRKKAVPVLPIEEKPLPSLLPMEVDDPLPYLQAFTPLTYTSTINLLPPSSSSPNTEREPPQLQQHIISASHPSGLFFSRISLTVNTSTFTTSSLEITKLDPAAESELGGFIRDQAEKKEISVLFWAMGRWAEIALKRAAFWCAVDTEFGTLEARRQSLLNLRGKRKRGDEEERTQQGGWSRKQLLPHMSRTHFEIVSEEKNVTLRIEWRMEFDWTGEVDSEISALAKIPGSWQRNDDRNSLTRIPDTFRRLVKEKGPLGAVRTVVGLLMGDA